MSGICLYLSCLTFLIPHILLFYQAAALPQVFPFFFFFFFDLISDIFVAYQAASVLENADAPVSFSIDVSGGLGAAISTAESSISGFASKFREMQPGIFLTLKEKKWDI